MSGGSQVRVERDAAAGTAWIVLDDPDHRNALNAALVAELKEALAEAGEDEAVRVVGLRGAGPDFCAGADLKEVKASMDAGALAGLADADALGELFLLLRRLPKPVVAAVHGRALAGGCGLATACDLIVASRDAEFGYPEVRLGFVPAMVMAILRRSLGEKQAFALVATGDRFDAGRAFELGLVHRVLDAGAFEEKAAAFVAELAGRSASAVALTKRLLYQLDGAGFEEGIRTGAEVNALARFTEDCRAGIERFLERRG
ncbi:MAG TPA: enoyl-CoA hydratase-related protein [Gemmatimonadota bacterium]|nr:enoyl-CoA hydratase-related protein [Gemmatimonadota bacterium]